MKRRMENPEVVEKEATTLIEELEEAIGKLHNAIDDCETMPHIHEAVDGKNCDYDDMLYIRLKDATRTLERLTEDIDRARDRAISELLVTYIEDERKRPYPGGFGELDIK